MGLEDIAGALEGMDSKEVKVGDREGGDAGAAGTEIEIEVAVEEEEEVTLVTWTGTGAGAGAGAGTAAVFGSSLDILGAATTFALFVLTESFRISIANMSSPKNFCSNPDS